jgi:hypothetical protein
MTTLKTWNPYDRLTAVDLNGNFTAVETPEGIVASAAGTTTQSAAIALTTVVEGKASYLAGGRIVTPRAGIYLLAGLLLWTGASSGTFTFSFIFTGTGAPTAPGPLQVPSATPLNTFFAIPMLLPANLQMTGSFSASAGAPTLVIQRFGFHWLGAAYPA